MAVVVPSEKNLMLDEDVKTGAAASEATVTKMASNIHLALLNNTKSFHFMANGHYAISSFPEYQVDLQWCVPFDCEVVKIYAFNKTAGTSGNTEIDVEKMQPGGSWGTIFTTRPMFPYTSGNDALIVQEFQPAVLTVYASSGAQVPVLISGNLDQNDLLRMNFVDKQQGIPEGFGIEIIVRPR